MSEGTGPDIVLFISDGIRGHENQSAGVAWWLSEICGARREILDIPRLKGWSRFLWYKIRSRSLRKGRVDACRAWLESVPESEGLLRKVKKILADRSDGGHQTLFISAGSSTAPWCLVLARVLGGRCCTIMTPSILGTAPFDFAIVPKHDFPKDSQKLLVTLGAPNLIRPGLLEEQSRNLSVKYPPSGIDRWAILIGGDDENYTLSPSWVRKNIPPLLEQAERSGTDVYITTSRRTSPEAEEAIISAVRGKRFVRALILASREKWNPVPGMLGLCGKIFCTEDSVSMISEAFTARRDVEILRVERLRGIRSLLQVITRRLVSGGFLPRKFLRGVPRFDMMIDSFKRIEEKDFNEALKAAMWMIEEWRA